MELYPSIEEAIKVAIRDCFIGGFYADKVVERQIKMHKKWGARDRKSFAFTFYEIVRWWKKLLHQIDIDFETYEFTEESFDQIASEVLSEFLRDEPSKISDPAAEASLPSWIYQLFKDNHPENTEDLLRKLNEPALLYLRLNTLKASAEDLISSFKKDGIDVFQVEGQSDCFYLKERKNVFITEAFKKGFFEVQDKGSQLISPFLQVEPKMRVIDACAGAGGKTLHLASLMQNKGKILAFDIHEYKLKELKKRAARDSVDIVETKAIVPKLIKRQKDMADRLLLDVPCSGLGVLRRNPDSKWKLSPERVNELILIQEEIISSYSKMVKVGGKMVYATCSILASENQNQVEKFLEKNPNWKLEQQRTLLPEELNTDGFFMARLLRQS